jgi:hypothetical protein
MACTRAREADLLRFLSVLCAGRVMPVVRLPEYERRKAGSSIVVRLINESERYSGRSFTG